MEDIIRIYPIKKEILTYPFRFRTEDFDEYNEMIKNKELQNNYKKWKNGVNYKTNRKITIHWKIYNDLKNIFIIKCKDRNVLFDELIQIDINKYLLETIIIYKDIDKKNLEIQNYNNIIDEIINKIKNIENYDNYIIFEGKKYSLHNVLNYIHRENNCFGNIIEDYYESCSCSSCENWNGCNRGGTQYYKCDKCDYKKTTRLGDTRNYKGK